MRKNRTFASTLILIGTLALFSATGGILAFGVVNAQEDEGEKVDHAETQVDSAHADAIEAVLSIGRGGFLSNCASCHGSNGEGEIGPSLVGNDLLADSGLVTDTIINGYSYMPPFGDMLSDEQVAAIATYIRNSWGNDFGVVTSEEAAASR